MYYTSIIITIKIYMDGRIILLEELRKCHLETKFSDVSFNILT